MTAPRSVTVAAATVALLAAALLGPTEAWADGATPAPGATPTSAAAPATTAPAPTAPAAAAPAKGCAGVVPKKPWRLVATRPDPKGSAVTVEWSPVGCTTGYRVGILATGVDRQVTVAGATASSVSIPDLSPSLSYRITVTSLGAAGDGGVSGAYRLHRSGPAAEADVSVDFPDPGPSTPVPPAEGGAGPWVNPEVAWTAPDGPTPKGFRLRVVGAGGVTVVEKTVAGTARSARLGDQVVAGVPYTLTITPVLADGSDGDPSRLSFGDQPAAAPEQVTGNAPVVQFSPVADPEEGRVLGYEIAYGALQATAHVFVSAPPGAGSSIPWIAVDPSFATVDGAESAVPLRRMVAIVRTITTMGRSAWTPARTLTYADVATTDAAYFAGIGHVGAQTVPRNGFLSVRGGVADVQVTDVVWSMSARGQAVPVSVAVFGPAGPSAPVYVQSMPATHLPDLAQDAWRATDLPLPDGWTSIVLRRGGADVARWVNSAGRPCVASVTYADAPTDLPALWRDSWCPA